MCSFADKSEKSNSEVTLQFLGLSKLFLCSTYLTQPYDQRLLLHFVSCYGDLFTGDLLFACWVICTIPLQAAQLRNKS